MLLNIINHIQVFFVQVLPQAISSLSSVWFSELLSLSPLMIGILLQLVIIVILIIAVRWFRRSKFSTLFDYIVEEVYKFFEEILEETWKPYIKTYIVTLFFIILLSNLSSWLLDWVRMIFVNIERLAEIVVIPTTSFEFNIALAVVWVVMMLWIQLKHLWWLKMLLEYVPLTGKNILTFERWNMNIFLYIPIWIVMKAFDIAISLFVWVLDIVGIFAKVISLSARLYGNMISWGILMSMLVLWINSATNSILWLDFPIFWPLILYVQWLLVVLIQAFVFPLLVAIFIKLVLVEEDEE